MKLNIIKVVFLFQFLIAFSNLLAQTNPYELTDRFGNVYSFDEIKIEESKNSVTAGLFEIFFDNNELSVKQKEIIIQVYTDLSYLIRPNATLPNGQTGKIAIEVIAPNSSMPVEALAGATPYFWELGSGVTSGSVWKYINTGFDPLANIAQGNYFQGYMMVRSTPLDGKTWFVEYPLNNITSSQYDFYTVMLHEALHMLGFYSTILGDGRSKLTSGNQVGESGLYSMFDLHLYQYDGENEIYNKVINDGNFYNTTYNTALNLNTSCGKLKYIFDKNNKSDNEIVYTDYSYQLGSSFSHFLCSENPIYLMTAVAGEGNICRHPHINEVKALQSIGYEITWVYANASQPSYWVYENPMVESKVLAGANDIKTVINTVIKYKYNVNFGEQISISIADIIANDYSTNIITGIDCPQIVYGGYDDVLTYNNLTTSGSLTFKSGTLYTGDVYIKYRPVTANGNLGNMTYIVVHVNDKPLPTCLTNDCNLICGGDFEEFTVNNLFEIGNFFIPDNDQNSPDLYTWNSYTSGQKIYANFGNTNCDFHGSSFANLGSTYHSFDYNPGRWIFAGTQAEAFFMPLNKSLGFENITSEYILKFNAINISSWHICDLQIYGANIKPFEQCTNTVIPLDPNSVQEISYNGNTFASIYLGREILPIFEQIYNQNTNSWYEWNNIEKIITNSVEIQNFINIYGDINYLIFKQVGGGLNIDNIELYKNNNSKIDIITSSSNNEPCVGNGTGSV